MSGLQSWCYTVFAGVLFSGIILLLTPGERFRPLMQLLLGAFLLVCLLTWGGQISIDWKIDTEEAEQRRQEIADRAEDYFAARVEALSQEELEKTAGEYLSDYGIKQGEFQIYIKTEEIPDGSKETFLLLRLPQRLSQHTTVISRALSYQFGVNVRIETYGTDAE